MKKFTLVKGAPAKWIPIIVSVYALAGAVWLQWQAGRFLWGQLIMIALALMAIYLLIFKDSLAAFVLGREQQEALDRLHTSESEFNSFFHYNPNLVVLFDKHGGFRRVNETAKSLLGYSEEELLAAGWSIFATGNDRLKAGEQLRHAFGGSPQPLDTAMLHKRGYRIDLRGTVVPVQSGTGSGGAFLICQDVTDRMRTEEQIRHLAYYDDLTGVPNRRLFTAHLQEAIEAARSHQSLVAVIHLDIDRFKLVNDSYGHDYGDMLLLQVAERLTRVSSENSFVARTEGDKFAVFCTGLTDKDEALKITAGFSRILDQPFYLEQYEIHTTSSIGIALYCSGNDDAEALIKQADIALSRAKETGRNNCQIYNSDMAVQSIQKLTLENELRRALAQDEFELFYQPQVDISSGMIIGVEALIRWNHPERGLVAPGGFIPFAEETGLIVQIGAWVLQTACRQNKLWQDMGLPRIPVAVNLSIRQFMQSDLRLQIEHVLDMTGLQPEYLELEITESMAMDAEIAARSLRELKELGVRVSIDDFGTGYSSFYYLKKFPLDKLKIDRSFVRDIMEDPNDAAIVASIIAITHHLNLKVVAEGVETEEQLQFLHKNRCNEVQGYLFSPPVTSGEMLSMLRGQSRIALV